MTPDFQNQIDYMVSKFQDSIAKFESLVNDNKKLTKENEDLRSSVKNLELKFDSMAVDIKSIIQSHASSIKAQSLKNSEIDKIHEDHVNSFSMIKNSISSVFTECLKSKEKVDVFLKMIDELSGKIDSVDGKYSVISDEISKINDLALYCKAELTQNSSTLKNHQNVYSNLSDSLAKFEANLLGYKKEFKDFVDKNSGFVSVLKEKIADAVGDSYKYTDKKVSEITIPEIPSLEDAKKAFQNQLEPVSLDAKNSSLRSINTDSKLHILDKKVEQIKLILDQLTIGK